MASSAAREGGLDAPVTAMARIDRALQVGWRIMTLGRTLLVTLCVALVFVGVGAIVPQATGSDDLALARQSVWLVALRGRAPSLANAVQASGALQLYASPLFRVLLGWIVGLCVVNLAAVIRVRVASGDLSSAWNGVLEGDDAAAWERIGTALVSAGLQSPRPVLSGDCQAAAVQRAGWRGWARAGLPLGVLVVLGASLVGYWWGWRSDDVTLLLGETHRMSPDSEITARLEEIRLIPQGDRRGDRVQSVVRLSGDGGLGTALVLDERRAARAGGLTLYQMEEGPALQVVVLGAAGQPAALLDVAQPARSGSTVRVALRGTQQEQQFLAQSVDLVVRLVHYSGSPGQSAAYGPLQVQLVRWSDGSVLLDKRIDADAARAGPVVIEVNDAQVRISYERYVVVRAEREPELIVALLGAVLVLVGLTTAVVWPQRRAWVVVCPAEGESWCRVDVPVGDAGADWVTRLRELLAQSGDRVR